MRGQSSFARHGQQLHFVPVLLVLAASTATLAAVLFGCGGGSIAPLPTTTTRSLIVADYNNNRVLIYDAPLSTGESANVVLGQANFTSATAGTTAGTMNQPSAVAVDGVGSLYVAENGNCRVTQFKPPFINGMSASVAIGQPDLATGNCAAATSASSLGNASSSAQVLGVAVDSGGNLWVADSGSNRILEYQPPFSNGMAATLVIGQIDFTHGSGNQGGAAPTSSSLADPSYPVFDSSGNLWIADVLNNRLLQFKPPFSNGMAASLVIGQADFTHGESNPEDAPTANSLSGPGGPAFDSSGRLWVADFFNNRVLEFEPPFSNGMAASLVIGQTNFTSGLPNQGAGYFAATPVTIYGPQQLAFDASGNLDVTDSMNNRTLLFKPPFSNGMASSLVIGQGNFTGYGPATTPTGQDFPSGVTTAP